VITWEVGDAGDPHLVARMGPQDLVIDSNFLCHMDPASAERCLRNLAVLVSPGGHAFVTGVDLDVRTNVAIELGWEPISDLRAEIHDGDPLVPLRLAVALAGAWSRSTGVGRVGRRATTAAFRCAPTVAPRTCEHLGIRRAVGTA